MEFLPQFTAPLALAGCFASEDTTVKKEDVLDAVRSTQIRDARRRRVAGWLEAVCGGAHSAMEMEAALSMGE